MFTPTQKTFHQSPYRDWRKQVTKQFEMAARLGSYAYLKQPESRTQETMLKTYRARTDKHLRYIESLLRYRETQLLAEVEHRMIARSPLLLAPWLKRGYHLALKIFNQVVQDLRKELYER